MNKNEFKAIMKIAKKMDWQNKPVECVIETINQMVRNQQALELDTVGECDDFEGILLSMALWDIDKLLSTRVVTDYQTLIWWHKVTFMEDMHLESFEDFKVMLDFYNYGIVEVYEMEEMARQDAYCDAEIMRDVMWMNHHC